jgi:MtrB/PioB family decaheme-associated outer membrane protein
MRITVLASTLLGLLLSGAAATAQVPSSPAEPSQGSLPQAAAPSAVQTVPTAPAKPQMTPPPTDTGATAMSGSFDLGGRGTTVTGDPGRYNEFRDLSNGLFLDNFGTSLQKSGWFVDLGGTHAGRQDAFYSGEAVRPGRLKIWGSFDRVPWLLSDTTRTIFQGVGTGILTIPTYVQSLLQANAAQTGPVAAAATPFDVSSQRKYSTGGVQYLIDPNTTLSVDVLHMDRSGVIVGAGTFGFSAADELPVPVDHHQTDVDATVERTLGIWLLRAGYTSSWFTNDNQSLTWSDPYQATSKPTLGSLGLEALAPNSFMQTVNGAVSVALPRHTRMTGTVALGSLTDNTPILPDTTNTTLPVFTLDRTTSEGDGRTTSGNFIFTSRPIRAVDVDIRYRYYDFADRTPIATQLGGRVEYDSTVELAPLTANPTTQFSLTSQSVDASANVDLGPASVGAAYSRDGSTYTSRLFQGSVTNAGRVTFDTTGLTWLTLHGRYEHSERRGNGLDNSDLVASGEQATLQTFDIADRNEDVGTVTASLMIGGSLSLNLSGGGGKDTYPTNSLSTGFGLANAQYMTYGAGFAATPTDNLSMSLSYDLNTYQTLQNSRSASPGVQFTDPTRDWSASGNDRTHSVLADLDVRNLVGKLRVKVTANFNKGSTLYLYGLAPVTTLPAVSQLPAVMSELRRGTIDVSYPLSERATVGLAYWYEQFLVSDFAQDANAIPTLNIPSLLTLGNVLLPYTAQTVFARVTYHW